MSHQVLTFISRFRTIDSSYDELQAIKVNRTNKYFLFQRMNTSLVFSCPRNKKHNERKRQINIELSSLPRFQPWKDCRIIHIDRSTPIGLLSNLIDSIRQTQFYTIDTESDYRTHQPCLIQIELVRSNSIVVLFEFCHFPYEKDHVRCHSIRTIFKEIFRSSNLLCSWGNLSIELLKFVEYGFFDQNMIEQSNTIDIQLEFQDWYNRTFTHRCSLSELTIDDDSSCTCLYRPIKQKHQTWSLQKAIAYTFGEFLDKRRTLSCWSRSLRSNHSNQRSTLSKYQTRTVIIDMIQYAIDDCLAVTKLAYLLDIFSS